MTKQTQPVIYKKILQVMQEVTSVGKDGTNTFQNYKYASDAQIIESIRPSLMNAGLLLLPTHEEIQTLVTKDSKGVDSVLTTVKVRYRIVDVETGESIESVVYGQGQDKGDKGIYKAATGAGKYLVLKTFFLPTLDDPENEALERKVQKVFGTGPMEYTYDDEPKPAAKPYKLKGNSNDII